MPPIHPAIVHFPIALVTLSVLADLVGYVFRSESLSGAALWSLAGAAVGAASAVIAGLFDMNRERMSEEAHHRVHFHMKVGFALLSAIVALAVWRWAVYTYNANAVNIAYLVGAFLVLGLTIFQGYLGGELVFSDGVGVAPTGQGTRPPDQTQDGSEQTAGGVAEHSHRH